jgi:protease secretion system membrane fusion protein
MNPLDKTLTTTKGLMARLTTRPSTAQAAQPSGGASGDSDSVTLEVNYRRVLRQGLLLVVFGFGSFIAWASLAPLDEGIPAVGTVAVETSRKRVDHLTGGLIERILVQEGQSVQAGDALVVLNETQSKSVLGATQGQRYTALATLERLRAELAGATTLSFSPELVRAAADNPEVAALMRAQQDQFGSRRMAFEGELRIIRESVRGLERQLESLAQLRTGREKQIALLNEQIPSYRDLRKEGFVSRNSLLELERQMAEVSSRQGEDLAQIAGVHARLDEFRMRGAQRQMEHRREVQAQLGDVQRDLSTLGERLTGEQDSFDRLVLRAPASGKVVDLAFHTQGGVIKPGERVLDIVPEHDALVIEARVAPQYIDSLHVGLPADVHLDAYASQVERPVISGVIAVVSADALVDPRSGQSYYAVRVTVPSEALWRLGALRLQPGMQTTVMVKTGERTLMTYLMNPLTRHFQTALNER